MVVATLGVRGAAWRAALDDDHAVRVGDAVLRWAVLAEDGWHDPSTRPPSLRRRRVLGAPVIETRVKVPGGDVACTAWAAPDRGGVVVLEWHNESPRAVAVAIGGSGGDCVVAARAASSAGADGLAWPARSWALPHAQTLRAVVPVAPLGRGTDESRDGAAWVAALAASDRVVGAWREVAHVAGRADLPDPRAAEALVAARCDLVLDAAPLAGLEDPVDRLLVAGEMARLREPAPAEAWEVADWCAAVARAGAPTRTALRALAMGARALAEAGERQGAADVAALAARLGEPRGGAVAGDGDGTSPGSAARRAVRAIAAIEEGLARVAADGTVHVLPDGVPEAWRGAHFEAHGLVAGAAHVLSYAVRWHGAAPALLWEVTGGDGVSIVAPAVDPRFASSSARGEVLLRS